MSDRKLKLGAMNPMRAFSSVRNHAENVGANSEMHAVRRARVGYWGGRVLLYGLASTGLFAVVARFQEGGVDQVAHQSVADVKSLWNGAGGTAEAQNLTSPETTTVTVSSTVNTIGATATSIECFGQPFTVTVESASDTPLNEIQKLNPDLDGTQVAEVYASPNFTGINESFDPTKLQLNDTYLAPTGCVEAVDGP